MNKEKEFETVKTGTTTVGIKTEHGVVLAADKRTTYSGSMIVRQNSDKITLVSDNMAITHSGQVSTIQLVKRLLKARMRLRGLEQGRDLSVHEAARLLANINFNNARQPRPEISHWLLGGYDGKPGLYDVQIDGAVIEIKGQQPFTASGSGSIIAYGLLEDAYEEGLSMEEAADIAERAVRSAMKRDTASGGGIDIVMIDEDGARYTSTKTIKETLE